MKTRIVLIACAMFMAFSVSAFAQVDEASEAEIQSLRMSKLSALFNLNVTTEIYLSYCDEIGAIDRGVYFMGNILSTRYYVAKELSTIRDDMDFKQAQSAVKKRANKVANKAYKHFEKKGCLSDYANRARRHAEKVGQPRTSEFLRYLRDIQNR